MGKGGGKKGEGRKGRGKSSWVSKHPYLCNNPFVSAERMAELPAAFNSSARDKETGMSQHCMPMQFNADLSTACRAGSSENG